jgi:hypothetical protein
MCARVILYRRENMRTYIEICILEINLCIYRVVMYYIRSKRLKLCSVNNINKSFFKISVF